MYFWGFSDYYLQHYSVYNTFLYYANLHDQSCDEYKSSSSQFRHAAN